IELVQDAGGVTALAHPMMTKVDELINKFVEQGMRGLEVYYPNCSSTIINHYEGLAKKYKLAATGGSDAHGEAKKNTFLGKIKIPYELVENLKGLV
ncbi:MAG: phosphatase, partial [Candidatus Omnitrophica bacterium]|nr:phosphatase [Candidatus Omnitrophota bacterium]